MDLQNQARTEPLSVEPLLHLDHRELDQIRGSPLHRRVDRGALGGLSTRAAARIDVRQPQAPTKNRLHVTLPTRKLARALHVVCNTGIAYEVFVDELLSRAALDAELRSEPECAHSIDQSEVHGLDVTALLQGHLFH